MTTATTNVANASFLPTALFGAAQYKGKKGSINAEVHNGYSNNPITEDSLLECYEDIFVTCGETPTPYHPLTALSAMQDTMNKACWNARRLYNAVQEEEAEGDWDRPIGTTRLEEIAAEIGVPVMGLQSISDCILDDFLSMSLVHTVLGETINSDETLAMFRQQSPVNVPDNSVANPVIRGTKTKWETTHETVTWPETLDALNEIAMQLAEENAVDDIKAKIARMRKQRTAEKRAHVVDSDDVEVPFNDELPEYANA